MRCQPCASQLMASNLPHASDMQHSKHAPVHRFPCTMQHVICLAPADSNALSHLLAQETMLSRASPRLTRQFSHCNSKCGRLGLCSLPNRRRLSKKCSMGWHMEKSKHRKPISFHVRRTLYRLSADHCRGCRACAARAWSTTTGARAVTSGIRAGQHLLPRRLLWQNNLAQCLQRQMPCAHVLACAEHS